MCVTHSSHTNFIHGLEQRACLCFVAVFSPMMACLLPPLQDATFFKAQSQLRDRVKVVIRGDIGKLESGFIHWAEERLAVTVL
jgi:hypothetical protein